MKAYQITLLSDFNHRSRVMTSKGPINEVDGICIRLAWTGLVDNNLGEFFYMNITQRPNIKNSGGYRPGLIHPMNQ